jgi:hypothetical protein
MKPAHSTVNQMQSHVHTDVSMTHSVHNELCNTTGTMQQREKSAIWSGQKLVGVLDVEPF